MSKNRLIWILALFLVNIITLPIAYAQAFQGTRLYFMLINAAIIAFVLFILQAFLIPQKSDKEKTSVWVIIIIASLVLGYLFGSTGFIWNVGPLARFFSIYVLVNATIIALFLYFVLGILKINEKLGSPEGKTGYGILLFFVSLLWAVGIGNNWVWEVGTISQLMRFLFGDEGILTLNQNRLFIFITMAALLSWFFNYLGVGKENSTINYLLAIILAANVASGPDPLTFKGVKNTVFVVGTIIIGGNLSGQATTWKGKTIGYFFAAGLMLWAISGVETAVTPEGRAKAAEKGIFSSIFDFVLDNMGWFIGIVVVVVLLMMIGRAETMRRILTLGIAGAKERINAIIKNAKFLRESPEGREPQVFRENRILFHMLANFTTRSEITYRYWGFVEQAKRVGGHIWETKIKKYPDQKILRKDIIATRTGGITSEGAHFEGWNRLNAQAVDLVNEFFWLTYWVYISAKSNFKAINQYKIEGNQYQTIVSRAQDLLAKIETCREQYKVRTESFGGHHVLNAYKGIILNMTNVTGDVLEHYQKFARPGAEFEGGAGFYGPSFRAEGRREPETGLILPLHEVNQFGEYIQDITDQRDKFGNLPDPRDYKKPRKVKPEDIIDYPDYLKLMTNIGLDWKGLAEDIRYGLWHPKSRTFQMYKQALTKAIYPEWADEQIPLMGPTGRIESSPSTGDEALDMRALANPGLHPYWGRKTFYAESPPGKNDPFHNPFPGVSSLGLAKYLEERVSLDMKDKARALEFMSKYPRDSAAPKKVTVRGEVKVKIGTRLGLGEAQQETRG